MNAEYHGQAREEMLPFVPDGVKRVLEVGCGAGRFGEALHRQRGAAVWGIERDPEAAAQAATRLERVLVDDAFAAVGQLAGERFDLVVCNDLLEHLPDPGMLLRELRGLVPADGRLLVSLPNMRHYKVLLHLLVARDWRYRDSGVLDRTHLRFFTRRSMLRLLEENGWRPRRCQGINGSRSLGLRLLNLLTLGRHADMAFVQFALLAEPAA